MIDMTFDWDEVEALIALLYVKGIRYLIATDAPVFEEEKEVDSIRLLQRLVTCNYPLVENASIALFILHPEFAPFVVETLRQSESDVVENLAVVTLATLYLQQWWLFRLTFALGRLPSFPETPFVSLWEERHLPEPGSGYGLHGLLALQEYQQRRYGVPLNFLDDWQNQINHLLAQEGVYQRELSDDLRETLVQLSV